MKLSKKEIKHKFVELEKFSKQPYIPIIRKKTCKYLVKVVKKNNYKNLLEIGTAIGYSGSKMLLSSNNEKSLLTIDKSEKMITQAKQTFEYFGLENQATIICDDAIVVLEKLVLKNKKFDFIFLDGPKGQYLKYLDFINKLLVKNGTLFVDDIMFYGLVDGPVKVKHKHRTIVKTLRNFIEKMQNNKNYKTRVYKIEDGFMINKKIS